MIIQRDGTFVEIILGNPLEFEGAVFQACVDKELWFAAAPLEESSVGYSLLGCSVSPGFDYRDWELASKECLLAGSVELPPMALKYIR